MKNDPASQSPGRRFADSIGPIETVLGSNTELRGELRCPTHAEVFGRIFGPCTVDGLLWLHEGAVIQGDVTAAQAILEGELEGNLEVTGNVELRSQSSMRGDIHAASIAIADGCFFEGKAETTRDSDGSSRSFQEKRGSGH